MKNSCCFLLLVFLSVVSCKKQNPFVRQEQANGYTVTHFDISEQQPLQAPLKLSELVKNIRMIPLETTKEGLIGPSATYYIGNSFILAFQEENILLFDSVGHFIRTIARQGKGPSEFGEVRDYSVDEENELLFVLDSWASSGLKCFHLKDSTYFRQIETVVPVNNAVDYLDNGNLLLVPSPNGDMKYYCYQQTQDGELKDYLPNHANRERHPAFRRLIYRVNDDFRYLSSGNMFSDDTVFHILNQQVQPTWIFHCSTNKHYKVFGETPGYLFFEFKVLVSTDESEATGGARVVALDYDMHSFYYDKKEGDLVAIEGVMDDCFSGKVWPLEYRGDSRIQNGNKLYINMSAMALLQDAGKKADSEVAVKFPDDWKKMMAECTEEDNPVLIIGDLK